MNRFVVLLRGVNVGGGRRVPMVEFKALLEDLGFSAVSTLLNSGNAVYSARSGQPGVHARKIHEALLARVGVDTPVIVKSAADFEAIAGENKLAASAGDLSRLLVAFTASAAALEALAPLSSLSASPERFQLGKHAAYLWCPDGILESKAASALLGKAGRDATTRNWGTFSKLYALVIKPG